MKALFVAPDLSVIAHVLGASETVESFKDSLAKITNGDYKENVKDIVKSPANLRYAWVKLDKTEKDVDFFSNLAILSANNSFGVASKDIIMTQDSVFVNLNLLQAFKEVSAVPEKESDSMDINLIDRVAPDTIKSISENMFEETRFYELVSTKNGPQMFMLAGCFTNDTWSILESIGPVSRKSPAMQKDGDCSTKRPGFCLLFGLSMTALAQIVENSDKFTRYVKEDFETFPRKENEAEEDAKD